MARPKDIFLIANYAKVPKDKSKTRAPGYMKDDGNISYTENVIVTRGLKDRDLKAAVILNLTQKTVQKFRFEGKGDWESLAAYYAKGYPQYLKLLEPPEEKVDIGEAAQENPEVIQEEIDNEILEDVKAVAEATADE